VPSGPLTQLPFQVLVTAAATTNDDYKSTASLARTHAITVLPAVSSLKTLRRVAKPSAATKPMIGFGNPLLDGNPRERPWEARWAAVARDKACKGLPLQQVAEATHRARGVLKVARRDGHADLADVRSLMPLPDTADELCGVAKDLKLSSDDIWLGARATEAAIKRLSAEGKLAQYHVLHLATHGTLAGEISGSSEPGLIFTPPKEATDLDDGYLSARRWQPSSSTPTGSSCRLATPPPAAPRGRRRCPVLPGRSSTRAPGRCWCRIGRWIRRPL
jgi:hypothetical protein